MEFTELLAAFGWALSKPLERGDDLAEYIPSQRLSEYVENQHFGGIRFPSAMEPDGTNIVLFDPTAVEILDSKLVQVTRSEIEYVEL